MPIYRHAVALGSSFAAGPGISPVVLAPAMRSGRNYAHVLADALGAKLTDLTISGATTATIADKDQRILWRKFPPQSEGIPSDADLITITAGGNDLRYIGSMLRIAWARRLRAQTFTRLIGDAFGRKEIPQATPDDVERAASGLTRIVESTRARAPGARVLLVDYLTVVGDQTTFTPATPFDPSEVTAFRDLGEQLSLAFVNAAMASGAELIHASSLSVHHALGSREPWVQGFRSFPLSATASSFHPNAAGMRAVAEEIQRVIER